MKYFTYELGGLGFFAGDPASDEPLEIVIVSLAASLALKYI